MTTGVTTYTASNRLPLQFTSGNVDIWGQVLNGALQRIEDMKDGVLSLAVSGPVTLLTANDTTDQAHFGVLDITGGSGGTITLPSLTKTYLVSNGATGAVALTTGAGKAVTLQPGDLASVACDGVNVLGGVTQSLVTTAVAAALSAAKAYTNQVSLSAAAGVSVIIGTGPNDVVQLDASSRLPAVDASQLVNLPLPPVGTAPSDLVQLDASSRLPAVDASQLFNLPLPPVGTAPSDLVQLDASSRLPAVDGSQLLNLPVQPDTTPIASAISLALA